MSALRVAVATLVAGLALLLCVAATATAAGADQPLSGTITLTGTDGKDDFDVTFTSGNSNTLATMTVEPAVAMTATGGSCPAETDPLTGRPVRLVCPISGLPPTVVVDLRRGDDQVALNDPNGVISGAQASGGAGNDTIQFATRGIPQTLRGDDGNDQLVASGRLSPSGSPGVTFDGGTGTDAAVFGLTRVTTLNGFGPIGVTASLETKSAVFAGINTALQQTTFRPDTLVDIEGLTGTEQGDILTGSSKADTIAGGGGDDNISGGDGDDSLQGGDDLDLLNGGAGADSLDGGLGIDSFPKGGGGDTFLTRDGYAEDVPCVKSDTIIDDLVDKVVGVAPDCAISTAAAKHRYDTKLSGRLAVIEKGALQTRVRCPARKSTTCTGELTALLGKAPLGQAPYRVRPGKKAIIHLPVGKADARRADGQKILLSATEVDADGRDRFVSRPTRVAKQRL